MTTSAPPLPAAAAAELTELRERLDGALATPGEPAYDALRASWNLTFDQRPALVVEADGPDDVVAAVAFAARHELTVAAQSTGHGAAVACDGGLLVRTGRMRTVEVDAAARTARIGAGARWTDVLPATAPLGLSPLLGFNPHVGVVGYTLGGGLGWLQRRHGLAVDAVVALDAVLPDGRRVRVTPEREPDLFWALRGAAGSFAVVVAIELRLVAVPELFGGMVLYPGERAAEVLAAYRGWIDGLTDDVTSSVAVLRVPPLPQVPQPLRGRTLVTVSACALAGPERAAELLAPVRELGDPVADLFRPLGPGDLGEVAMDPVDPMPAAGHAVTVAALNDEVAALVAGAAAGEQPFAIVELRHLGGAVDRPGAPCALARPDGQLLLHVEAPMPPGPPGAAAHGALRELAARMAPLATGTVLPSFLGEVETGPERVAQAYAADGRDRLAALKRAHDPGWRLRFGRPIPSGWAVR